MSTKAIREALYYCGTVAADTTQAHEAYRRAREALAAIEADCVEIHRHGSEGAMAAMTRLQLIGWELDGADPKEKP